MNELERRMYEIDRLAGLPVGQKPPVYYPIKPHRWTPIGMAIALVPMIGLGFIVGYLGHSALARNGRFARVAKRWTRFLFILPALFVLVAAGAYGLQSWRLMTLQLVLIGWQPIGTLLLAAWLKRELSRDA